MNDNLSEQMNHYKRWYPHKRLFIENYGLVPIDTLSNHADIVGIINSTAQHCAYCKQPIQINSRWRPVIHNPPESDKPINFMLFCDPPESERKCAIKWGEALQRLRNKY